MLYVITFGIYRYLISNKRKLSLQKKRLHLINEITYHSHELEIAKREILNLESLQISISNEIKDRRRTTDKSLSKALSNYKTKIATINALPTECTHDTSFKLLKNFSGLEYEKIIGCYIIHNRENNKYYVGQSKDVLKRLKQHFKGTVPNNIIFAEDYYASKYKERENLFEVKIIPCTTKDELDKTEKELIEQYNSWQYGYNGTSGNN